MVSIQNEIRTRYKFAWFEAIKGQDREAFQDTLGFSLLERQCPETPQKNEIYARKTRSAWILVINLRRRSFIYIYIYTHTNTVTHTLVVQRSMFTWDALLELRAGSPLRSLRWPPSLHCRQWQAWHVLLSQKECAPISRECSYLPSHQRRAFPKSNRSYSCMMTDLTRDSLERSVFPEDSEEKISISEGTKMSNSERASLRELFS